MRKFFLLLTILVVSLSPACSYVYFPPTTDNMPNIPVKDKYLGVYSWVYAPGGLTYIKKLNHSYEFYSNLGILRPPTISAGLRAWLLNKEYFKLSYLTGGELGVQTDAEGNRYIPALTIATTGSVHFWRFELGGSAIPQFFYVDKIPGVLLNLGAHLFLNFNKWHLGVYITNFPVRYYTLASQKSSSFLPLPSWGLVLSKSW